MPWESQRAITRTATLRKRAVNPRVDAYPFPIATCPGDIIVGVDVTFMQSHLEQSVAIHRKRSTSAVAPKGYPHRC